MKKIVIDNSKKKTLIVSGCSHTQGCAFIKNEVGSEITNENVIMYELASPALKSKYKKEHVTAKFITEQLTWGGYLKKYLKYDEIYNLGYGGQGIEAVIRAIRNYTLGYSTLKNHTFVIQIPNPSRKEILQKITSKKLSVEQLLRVLEINGEDKFDFQKPNLTVKALSDNFVDFAHIEITFMIELYFLQEYLESKGANVRMFILPFNNWTISKHEEWATYLKQYKDFTDKGFEKVPQRFPPLEKIVNALNIIDMEGIEDERKLVYKNLTDGTLHREGLLNGDHHYSENGNIALAKTIKKSIDIKSPEVFTLTGIYTSSPKKII